MSAAPELDAARFALHHASPRGFAQAYTREGVGGVPLLLLHGWPETRRIWWRNIAPLAEAGFEVIAPDLRGFGGSATAVDGGCEVSSHSRDLHALLREHLGHERVIVAAGDLGGVIAQDLSLRFPGFVERLVLFNCPLPIPRDERQERRTHLEIGDPISCRGADTDATAAEIDTSEGRRRHVATFYTSRLWAHPGRFTPEAVDFMTEPFANGAALHSGFGSDEGVFGASETASLRKNPTPALILFGTADTGIHSDFDALAARVFSAHVGPFRIANAGHFLQWEAADAFNGVVGGLREARPRALTGGVRAFVSLGANEGDRELALCGAVAALRATWRIGDVVVSPVYETDPVGPGEQGLYLNAVLRLETTLSPEALLARLHAIERAAGRERGPERNAPRTLDLDLLLYGDRRIDSPELEVPHPRMCDRPFVLEPLRDLAPDLVHPSTRERIGTLAAKVRDPAAVRRRDTRGDPWRSRQ